MCREKGLFPGKFLKKVFANHGQICPIIKAIKSSFFWGIFVQLLGLLTLLNVKKKGVTLLIFVTLMSQYISSLNIESFISRKKINPSVPKVMPF